MNAKNMILHTVLMLGVLGLGMVSATSEARAEDVSVEVRSIAATKGSGGVDPKLHDIKGQLEKGFGSYTSFTLIDQANLKIAQGQQRDVSLPNGSSMSLTFHGFAGNLAKLGMAIGERLNTTVRLSHGSTFFQAGMTYKDGILILAIKVL